MGISWYRSAYLADNYWGTAIRGNDMNVIGKVATPATMGAAGSDLYSTDDVWIKDGTGAVISTGVKLEIPEGYCALVMGRSGLAFNQDVIAHVGLIDSDYRGEVKVKLFNLSSAPYHVHEGDRVAQLLFLPYRTFELSQVNELGNTARAEGGFGSTGR